MITVENLENANYKKKLSIICPPKKQCETFALILHSVCANCK